MFPCYAIFTISCSLSLLLSHFSRSFHFWFGKLVWMNFPNNWNENLIVCVRRVIAFDCSRGMWKLKMFKVKMNRKRRNKLKNYIFCFHQFHSHTWSSRNRCVRASDQFSESGRFGKIWITNFSHVFVWVICCCYQLCNGMACSAPGGVDFNCQRK